MIYNVKKHESGVNVEILESKEKVALVVAERIMNLISERAKNGLETNLVLPTGSTPIPVYKEMIRIHKEKNISFSTVRTFNLDEYYPMKPTDKNSYQRYMENHLFKFVDLKEGNTHVPKGDMPLEEVGAFCEEYEEKIRKAGGIHAALLGIGQSGHIAFNEPGSKKDDKTRLVLLHQKTRDDAQGVFGGLKNTPMRAITMGIGSILAAKEVILIATGESKAAIVKKTLEEEIDPVQCPAAFLKTHPNCTFVLDEPCSEHLNYVQRPWLVQNPALFKWSKKYAKDAVIWLSEVTGKTILQLTEDDFHSHHLTGLLYWHEDDVDDLCKSIFNDLLVKIHTDTNSLLPLNPDEKIICFSPHPDDDVLSMGLSLLQMTQQRKGKNMIVAYQTSGSNAVRDDDLKENLRFSTLSADNLKMEGTLSLKTINDTIYQILNNTGDDKNIRELKSNVRKAEAINAIESLGLKAEDAVFLDMPFYNRKQKDFDDADVQRILDLFEQFNPDHIFVAGDLQDPHGTHGICYMAIKKAVELYRKKGNQIKKIFLYKGAWNEYPVSKISAIIPGTKKDMDRKIYAVHKHGSQMLAMFKGDDEREFAERAKDRNLKLAETIHNLGLPSFYACEAFCICDEMPDK